MNRIFYKPNNAFVGDLIPYYENGTFYLYYLHDPRENSNCYAENTTWHLVETKDFINYVDKGEAIPRGCEQDPNFNIYTGSVIKDHKGIYHAFYTAYNEKLTFEGKSVQSVMKASSDNLESFTTDLDFRITADGEMYEEFDWRDPFVFWNDEEGCYYMLLAARLKNSPEIRGGCIALCTSTDLINWEYKKPFYSPKMFITMECPELFHSGDYWYLVFSTFSSQFVTHYRYSKSINGPWLIPEIDTFDSRANYAIKTVTDNERRFLCGWIPTKTGQSDSGEWEWGGNLAVYEIKQDLEGKLSVNMLPETCEYHNSDIKIDKWIQYNNENLDFVRHCISHENSKIKPVYDAIEIISSLTFGAKMFETPWNSFQIDMDLYVPAAHEFGIILHSDQDVENGYFLKMDCNNGYVAWDMWPRTQCGKYQWQIKGDIPYQIESKRKLPKTQNYHLTLIREDDICTVCINHTLVISDRLYDHKGGISGIYVVQGIVAVEQIKLKH